jgi:hypothetical protein
MDAMAEIIVWLSVNFHKSVEILSVSILDLGSIAGKQHLLIARNVLSLQTMGVCV